MATPASAGTPGLGGAWSTYRIWSATARYHKSRIDFWNKWSLWLAIGGAVLAALGQQLASAGSLNPLLVRGPGVLSSAMIALAAYFSAQAVAGNRERLWIRCRAAAESIKSLIYLYRASVAPFDKEAARSAEMRNRIEKSLADMKDVEVRPADPNEGEPELPPLTVDRYITERVDDQITWYRKRVAEFQASSDRFQKVTFALGALSVLLGLASAIGAVSIWLAVIATVTTAISAFVKHQRFQGLIGLYQATAVRLQLLKDEWAASGNTEADKAARDSFIQRCEETLALENGAWVAQWSEQQSAPATP